MHKNVNKQHKRRPFLLSNNGFRHIFLSRTLWHCRNWNKKTTARPKYPYSTRPRRTATTISKGQWKYPWIDPSGSSLYRARSGTCDWKHARVSFRFKKGITQPANYWPSSLISFYFKTMEHVGHSQGLKHLEHHGILTDYQFSFRKKCSFESQIELTIQDMAFSLNDCDHIDVVRLDLSEAFDQVPQKRFPFKLDHYRIRSWPAEVGNKCLQKQKH